jgi:hypothetical protein
VTSALADEYDARAADLVRETGATFDRRSSLKIFLKLGGFREFAVECAPALGVDVGVNTGLPPDGGLRAGTHEDGYLVIFPTTDCKVLTGLRRSIFSFALPAA